jgi:hypothetical protein
MMKKEAWLIAGAILLAALIVVGAQVIMQPPTACEQWLTEVSEFDRRDMEHPAWKYVLVVAQDLAEKRPTGCKAPSGSLVSGFEL